MADRKTLSALTKVRVEIPAYSTNIVDYMDTKPNYFRVQNQGDATIYCGLASMPTDKSFDFSVKGQTMKMYAEPFKRPKLYLYNPSGSPVTAIVVSFQADFDPLAIALSEIQLDFSAATLEVDSTISSFKAALPTGSNKIGKVDLDGAIPAGTNNIGKVDVNSLPAAIQTKLAALPNKDYTTALANILAAIGNISSGSGGDGAWTAAQIASLLGYNANLDGINSKLAVLAAYDHTAPTSKTYLGTAAQSYTGKVIKMISNDGENSLVISYTGGGSAQTFTLGPGESITDFALGYPAQSFTVGPVTSGNQIVFRLLLVV